VGSRAVLALQRRAGNQAVTALMAAKQKAPSEQAVSDMDSALREIRSDDPVIDKVEVGLKAAKDAGVPVDLEGQKPPASALAVVKTGFGPGSVAAKKAKPPPKAVPKVSPVGKAGSAPTKKTAAKGKQAAKKGEGGKGPTPGGSGGGAVAPGPVSGEKLLEPPVPPTPVRPEDDPAFASVTNAVGGAAAAKKAHPTAASKAAEAQEAALAPPDDLAGQAKASKVDTMDAQQQGSFDKKAFIAAVKAAIEAKSPKTLEEADKYKESGKAAEVKTDVQGLVGQGKEEQSKDIEDATTAAPDTSTAVPKPVKPMGPEQAGSQASVPAQGAVPKPAPGEQVNLQAGKHEANQEMAEAGVTDKQLAESKEPAFEQAVADKKTAAEHADKAPAEYREQEQQVLEQSKAEASAETVAGLSGMQSSQVAALGGLAGDKEATKSKDEQKRAAVTAKIQGIYAATEADVKQILDGIDPKVEAAFETGEASARSAFEAYVDRKMRAYKADRYGGWLGGFKWAKDKLLGMPSKVNEFYEAGRELYLQKMDGVIERVATIVGGYLTKAKKRIAAGKAEMSAYVKSLPADLRKVGSQASAEIGERFSQLESDVNNKQQAMVDSLATKYTEARKGLDERIQAMQAENRGLVDKVVGAIKGVINTIRELTAMLRGALARASGVIGKIIEAPGKFLDNLIAGVKGGITKFKDNILDHLRKGLMSWLFGALAAGGIEMPESFNLKGIIQLLASIFGLTWANIRRRVTKRIGERAMGVVEKGVGIFQVMATEGIGGLWRMFLEKIGDVKEMIMEQAKDFVVTQIIKAGITWLIGLLNPAAAFIKACKLIYDIIMFFVNNARRIVQFVTTVIDSVVDIVRGNVSGVVNKIESVLSQMVPIIISFLASVLGLSGIGDKIRQIVKKLQRPVNKALDFVINKGLKLAGPIIRGIKGIGRRVKAKFEAGKAWAKGKARTGAEGLRAARDRMLGITWRQEFTANSERHSVYTKKRRPGQVFVASQEQPAASAVPTARVRSLSSTFATLAQRGEVDAARRVFGDLVEATKQRFLRQPVPGLAEDAVGPPPGGNKVATSGFHGEKPSSNRAGHPLFWLESEHVIPFALGKSLWRALRLPPPGRGEPPDKGQTTIMIYERAARFKTDPDNAMSAAFRGRIEGSREVARIARLRTTGAVGLADKDAEDALAWVLSFMEAARQDAVARTAAAIDTEHSMVAPGASAANGARRGEGAPKPSRGQVDDAAGAQYDQVVDFVRQATSQRESGHISLGHATVATLQVLPGVGPSLARRIYEWGQQHGGFAKVDDLLQVRGIGEGTLERLRPLVRP
jgi:competence ComEA-like helix-hairpin-helix protein